tara:strand:- start:50 stop:427 length:378 start_codon:yes stop_codon:yes gene_type:complete
MTTTKLNRVGSNQTEIATVGKKLERVVFYSYETPVVVKVKEITDEKWIAFATSKKSRRLHAEKNKSNLNSVTTSKHINNYLGDRDPLALEGYSNVKFVCYVLQEEIERMAQHDMTNTLDISALFA